MAVVVVWHHHPDPVLWGDMYISKTREGEVCIPQLMMNRGCIDPVSGWIVLMSVSSLVILPFRLP